MNNVIHKFFRAFLVAVCLICSDIVKAYDFEVNGLYYNILSNNQVEVTYKKYLDRSYSGILTIPERVNYGGREYVVCGIGDFAFWECDGLIGSVNLPPTITTIGKLAFHGCSGLVGTLTMSNSLKTIGQAAFSESGFTGPLIIPNSVTSIESQAFQYCKGFNGDLSLSSSLTSINSFTFDGCTGLKGQLILPNNIRSIGTNAFAGCGFVGPLIIPNSVNSVGDGAFVNCGSLDGPLTIPNSVISIGNYAFSGCVQLKKVVSEIVNPFSIETEVFYLPQELHECLEVPKETINMYKALLGWTYYFSKIVETGVAATTYSLSIKSLGNGSVSYGSTTIRNETKDFTVDIGTSVTVYFSADEGYRLKSVKVNNISLSGKQYCTTTINRNTTIEVEYEALPTTSYTLSITSIGNGSTSYNGTTIRSQTSTFTVNEGSSAKILFTPDDGYQINAVKVNGSTVSVSNNEYTISSISENTTVEVEFVEQLNSFEYEGVNYNIVSRTDRIVYVAAGDYGKVLEVPWLVNYQDMGWLVDGVENGAFDNNTDLAAIIWHPDTTFKGQVSNPNLLLYVSKEHFAPDNIKNVVVNGIANKITLTDVASGNNFYCPQEFTAKTISYTHHYKMETGLGNARGWETIALPFDVQKITHQSKGEIVPFSNWKSGDAKKPFWLMTYGASGWVEANGIKANTPYIISMPNHSYYKEGYKLNGNVTFFAEDVTIPISENINRSYYNGRTFVPNYTNQSDNSYYILNVNNDYVTYNGNDAEGSIFFIGLRAVRPFEAYMTSASQTRSTIAIGDDMTTGIRDVTEILTDEKIVRVYNLNGQLIMAEENKSVDEIKALLSAGVYIVNGKKLIIK